MTATRQVQPAALALCLLASGCPAPSREATSGKPAEAPRRTTDGAIAAQNLDAKIESWEHILKDLRPGSVQAMAGLVDLYKTRAQYFGRLADYDRAEHLAELAVKTAPADPEAWVARAGARAALHRFEEALADADAAEQREADPRAVRALRASVLQAQGKLDQALELRRAAAVQDRTVFTLGALGAAEASAGHGALAEQHFTEAVRAHRDASPLPIAWIDFQRGLLAERSGAIDAAARAYGAAQARLPQYAQAASHLAGIEAVRGNRARAIEQLRPLLVATDDPEYVGQLADLTPEKAEAAKLRARAAARYEELLARHPQAFADHAARFFLGSVPVRALQLAQQNLALRRTTEAFDLALVAAERAQDVQVGCAIAREARTELPPSRRTEVLAARACPQGVPAEPSAR